MDGRGSDLGGRGSRPRGRGAAGPGRTLVAASVASADAVRRCVRCRNPPSFYLGALLQGCVLLFRKHLHLVRGSVLVRFIPITP